jgi:thiol-disulfide isomerase/thioredoxin
VVTGLIVLGVVLVLASGFGLWRKRTDGTVRIQGVSEQDGARAQDSTGNRADGLLTSDRLGRELGSRATLLQFSSAFCQPCRATKVILADVASRVDGVEHIEIDAESHLDLVREVGIMRTPTTLVLDGSGRITARASGVPRREQVLAALDVSVR